MQYIQTLRLFLIGLALGIANVIPGVSGGTMAVVFNVYDKIIELISFNLRKIFTSLGFIAPLAAGMAIGVVGFSRVVLWLLEHCRFATICFFIGLIWGSLPLIYRKLQRAKAASPLWHAIAAFALGVGLLAALSLVPSSQDSADSGAANALVLLLGGLVAAIAMLVPGVSGSLVLLALGLYPIVMQGVSRLDLSILAPFAIGVLVGLILGAAIVRALLAHFSYATMAFIAGLVLASPIALKLGPLPALWPLIAVATVSIGFAISYASSYRES